MSGWTSRTDVLCVTQSLAEGPIALGCRSDQIERPVEPDVRIGNETQRRGGPNAAQTGSAEHCKSLEDHCVIDKRDNLGICRLVPPVVYADDSRGAIAMGFAALYGDAKVPLAAHSRSPPRKRFAECLCVDLVVLQPDITLSGFLGDYSGCVVGSTA